MILDESVYLEHYGVKGMKWGVRKDRPSGVSRSVNRSAKKDAKEFARAKAFTGEGAGNRRKHIKTSVETKSKRDPNYKKAFESHLSREATVMDKHVTKAKSERKRIDRNTKFKQRTGLVARKLTGEWGTQAAFASIALSGFIFLKSDSGRKLLNTAYNSVSGLTNRPRTDQDFVSYLEDYFSRNS